MNLFLKKLSTFSLLFVVLFFGIIYLEFKTFNSITPEINTIKRQLILGDSNTECALNDTVLYNTTNLSSSGESYFYSFLKLKYLLDNNCVVDTLYLSFSPHNLFDNGWLYNNGNIYSRFKTYYSMMSYEDFTYLIKSKPLAVINATRPIPRQLAKDIILKIEKGKFNVPGGYQYLNRDILQEVIVKLRNNEPLPFFKIPKDFTLSKAETTYLKKIISLCASNHIDLFLINTPKRDELLKYKQYGVTQYYEYYEKTLYDVKFLDFSKISMPDEYYGDLVHLNFRGAEYFSKIFKKNKLDYKY